MCSEPDNRLPDSSSWSPRQVIQATLMVVLVLLGFGALVAFHLAIFSLLIAIVIDTAINPIVEAVYRRGVPRAAAVGGVYLGAAALLVALGWLSAPLLADQAV